jgi:hypothetical protein
VIGEEVEGALLKAVDGENIKIIEFTVAPKISQDDNKSYHEWFIEFENVPRNLKQFAHKVDENLRKRNIYYDDLIKGNILQPLKIIPIQKNGFINYMKSIGKLGGQNKVPRLSNDRTIADQLQQWVKMPSVQTITNS